MNKSNSEEEHVMIGNVRHTAGEDMAIMLNMKQIRLMTKYDLQVTVRAMNFKRYEK